jgi:hypothetical protein
MTNIKLDNFAKLHAFEFLNESEEDVKEGTLEIREYIEDHTDIDPESISDQSILYFLRASKFQIEKAKKKIKRLVMKMCDSFIVFDLF